MKDKIEINKIELNIAGQKISLKPEQAKELKRILNDMFEEKVEHHWHRYWWNYPCTYTPYWTVTCSGISSTSSGTPIADGTSSTIYLTAN